MRKQLIMVLMIVLLAMPAILGAGTLHFGITSAVKDKVEEAKEKRDKDKEEQIDNAPEVTISSPITTASISGMFNITAEAKDDQGITKVEFYINGALKSADSVFPYSYNWDTTQYGNGSYIIMAKAYDTINQTASSQLTITVDNSSVTTININSPNDNSTVSGTVNVAATANDDQGVSKVEFYIDETLKETDTTSPYSYSWDTTQYSNGVHLVKATAYNTASQTVSDQHAVTVNNVSIIGIDNMPAVTLTAPADSAAVSGTISVAADASDDQGVSKVEFYIDGILKGTDTTSPYSYSWNTVQYSSGTHTVKATVYDTASQTVSDQHSVTIDNAWKIQTVDSTGDVGGAASLAVDSNGQPHISYYDYTNEDLKYARWTGTAWSIETVDSTGDVGEHTSIAIDSNNQPHISYRDYTNKDLKYARWTGTAWSIETVDSTGDVGGYTSIAIDSNNQPHISYRDYTNEDLKYARWTGTAWNIEKVDITGDMGWHTSIAVDKNNYPHISYYYYHDYTDINGLHKFSDLKYAKGTGTAWSIETVDSTGDTGEDTSIAIDSNNRPHISYHDAHNEDLKYAQWTGSSWNLQIVDHVGHYGTAGVIYLGISENITMDIDSSDNPHISYRDLKNADLKYTRWTGTAWSIETVGWVYGNAISIAIDSSNHPHISYNTDSMEDLYYATK